MSPRDLKAYNIYEGETITLEYEGDIKVSGKIITGTRNLKGEIILVTFTGCKVTHKDNLIYNSGEGLYSIAIGVNIESAYNGPADLNSFNLVTHTLTSTTIHPERSPDRMKLEELYGQIRAFREGTNRTISRNKVFKEVRENHPNDWLLPVELYELAKTNGDQDFAQEILEHLEIIKQNNPKLGHLIDDGLRLVDSQTSPVS